MRQFFKTTRFKVMLGIAGALILIMIILSTVSGWMAPQSNVIGTIFTPVQKFTANVGDKIGDFFGSFGADEALIQENEALKEELREKTSQLIDYEKIKQQNEFYKDFLGLKEANPDFEFVPAMSVGEDPLDAYRSFTIDKGTLDGISPKDPVITADGLVGYIHEAGANYSTVVTVLNPEVQVGAYDSRSRDAGVVEGSPELAGDGLCRLSYLKRSAAVKAGDYVVTSGKGGVFPEGLLIGTVGELSQDEGEVTVYAVIEPAISLSELRDVMVITSFEGQGILSESEETD